jgi:hypothetical protein
MDRVLGLSSALPVCVVDDRLHVDLHQRFCDRRVTRDPDTLIVRYYRPSALRFD